MCQKTSSCEAKCDYDDRAIKVLEFRAANPARRQLFDVLRGENGEISPVGRVLILAPDLSAGLQFSHRSASFRCRKETFACRDKEARNRATVPGL
jgi:hypothetical protein